jgi:hypothetical protein
MFQFMGGFILAVAMLSSGATFAAPDLNSANYVMTGCRSFLTRTPSNTMDDAFLKGRCVGIVDTVAELTGGVCHPAGATTGQSVRIVVKYIDDQPARLHETFSVLAREALQAAWPCKN